MGYGNQRGGIGDDEGWRLLRIRVGEREEGSGA